LRRWTQPHDLDQCGSLVVGTALTFVPAVMLVRRKGSTFARGTFIALSSCILLCLYRSKHTDFAPAERLNFSIVQCSSWHLIVMNWPREAVFTHSMQGMWQQIMRELDVGPQLVTRQATYLFECTVHVLFNFK
jgi:hypothetical protein